MSKIFKIIFRFIDKKIVLPIAKLISALSDKFKFNSKSIEKIITKKSGLIVTSLILAIIISFVVDRRTDYFIEKSADVLYKQKITANYNNEAYVVTGLPKTVDITLIGRKSDIYLAKQFPTNDITVDLTGLKPGIHKVNLKYKKALSSVEYKLDPSSVTIEIYEKNSQEKEVSYEVINKDKLNSTKMVSEVSLSEDRVFVKSNDATLKKIAYVKALIDLDELDKDINNDVTIGEHTVSNVKLVAYDKNSNKVNVEITPAKISATVKITSPQKTVPIKVIPKKYENVKVKAISKIITSINNVIIYGAESKLEKINYLPVEIDVSELKENKKYSLTLVKPKGVRALSENSITVSIDVEDETYKEIDNIYLEYENLGDGLAVQATSENSTKISVSLKGVDNVLKDLDPSTIKAYVDLKDLGVGEHEIDVKVEGSDLRVKYYPKTKKVKLKITQK